MKVSRDRGKNRIAENEFRSVERTNHENVLKYFDCFYDRKDRFCFITELCEVYFNINSLHLISYYIFL